MNSYNEVGKLKAIVAPRLLQHSDTEKLQRYQLRLFLLMEARNLLLCKARKCGWGDGNDGIVVVLHFHSY